MKEDNVVQEKSYAFAVRVAKVYWHLADEKKEYVLSKQLKWTPIIGPPA